MGFRRDQLAGVLGVGPVRTARHGKAQPRHTLLFTCVSEHSVADPSSVSFVKQEIRNPPMSGRISLVATMILQITGGSADPVIAEWMVI